MPTAAHVGDGVPVLRYGPDNNFAKFKEKLSRAAIEKYGDLGRLVETGQYFEPTEPNIEDYDLDNDPHGVNVADYREDMKDFRRKISQMEDDKPILYATILGKLSTESMDELKRHEDYEVFNIEKDPLMLWLAITMIHQVASVSNVFYTKHLCTLRCSYSDSYASYNIRYCGSRSEMVASI